MAVMKMAKKPPKPMAMRVRAVRSLYRHRLRQAMMYSLGPPTMHLL